MNPDALSIDIEGARSMGKAGASEYQSAEPFPHICIDDFLPSQILERVCAELAELPDPEAQFADGNQNRKTSYNPDRLPRYTRELFHALNSRPFLNFLRELTGIKGLIPDPYFAGAGIHQVANGGHLDIHADFNVHQLMRLERRLNVLIYLNPDWQPEWGGQFEIWSTDMKERVKAFDPIFNRMVCFSTSSNSFHGNPEPVRRPDGGSRFAIALYYYTATWDDSRREHSTLFQPRPGTKDTRNRKVVLRRTLQNLLPPFLYRPTSGVLRRLGI